MIQDDLYFQLGVLADGEAGLLSPGERAALEAQLDDEPAFAHALARLRSLDAAARMEMIPECDALGDTIWPLVSERLISFPVEPAQKLKNLAAAEVPPALTPVRSAAAWRNIWGRAGHTFDEEHLHLVPAVAPQNWDQAWKFISTRTRLTAVEAPPKQASVPAPVQRPATSPVIRPATVKWNMWSWGAGLGLAAAAMLAIVFSTPPNPPPMQSPVPGNSMAMSIPESQDERYGVLVKYVPGSDDPVICLYEKQSNGMIK